jgi:hypothetical protein
VNHPRYAESIGHTEKSTEVVNAQGRTDADLDDSREKDENNEAGRGENSRGQRAALDEIYPIGRRV